MMMCDIQCMGVIVQCSLIINISYKFNYSQKIAIVGAM